MFCLYCPGCVSNAKDRKLGLGKQILRNQVAVTYSRSVNIEVLTALICLLSASLSQLYYLSTTDPNHELLVEYYQLPWWWWCRNPIGSHEAARRTVTHDTTNQVASIRSHLPQIFGQARHFS